MALLLCQGGHDGLFISHTSTVPMHGSAYRGNKVGLSSEGVLGKRDGHVATISMAVWTEESRTASAIFYKSTRDSHIRSSTPKIRSIFFKGGLRLTNSHLRGSDKDSIRSCRSPTPIVKHRLPIEQHNAPSIDSVSIRGENYQDSVLRIAHLNFRINVCINY